MSADRHGQREPDLLRIARETAARRNAGRLVDIAKRDAAQGGKMGKPSPDLQRRLDLAGATPQDLVRAQRASARVHTGGAFQDEIRQFAHAIETQSLGFLQPHHPEFKRVGEGGAWVPMRGGAPCDFSGHVNATEVRRGETVGVPSAWTLDRGGRRVPSVFDAKVAGAAWTAYEHEPNRRHQLGILKTAARCGSAAFLYVYVRRIEACVVVTREHFDRLLVGGAVPMFEILSHADAKRVEPRPIAGRPALLRPGDVLASAAITSEEPRPVRLLLPAVTRQPLLGWDFTPALGYILPP